MTELDPEIWKNPTLGSATTNAYLDEVEAQTIEDRNARIDGREPKIAVHFPRYPQLAESGSVPSEIKQLEFIEPGSEIPSDPTPPVAEDPEGDFGIEDYDE
jgi:hypothetical protein